LWCLFCLCVCLFVGWLVGLACFLLVFFVNTRQTKPPPNKHNTQNTQTQTFQKQKTNTQTSKQTNKQTNEQTNKQPNNQTTKHTNNTYRYIIYINI
jgi:hypothetical protein